MNIETISSININGKSSLTRVGQLRDFIRRHEFDIFFIMEAISLDILNEKGYITHINIRTAMWGRPSLRETSFHLRTSPQYLQAAPSLRTSVGFASLLCTHRLVQRDGRKGKDFLTPHS